MTRKRWMIVGAVLAALMVVGAVGAVAVYAQTPTPPAPGTGSGPGGPGGPGGGPHQMDQAQLDAAAKALGITADELSSQLQSGKTLDEIASAQGVKLQVVQDAIQTVRNSELTTQIQQAVTDGKMTQDKADWLLEGISKGYLDGPGGFGFGPGRGFGPGGPGMDGNQPAPQATPSTTP